MDVWPTEAIRMPSRAGVCGPRVITVRPPWTETCDGVWTASCSSSSSVSGWRAAIKTTEITQAAVTAISTATSHFTDLFMCFTFLSDFQHRRSRRERLDVARKKRSLYGILQLTKRLLCPVKGIELGYCCDGRLQLCAV